MGLVGVVSDFGWWSGTVVRTTGRVSLLEKVAFSAEQSQRQGEIMCSEMVQMGRRLAASLSSSSSHD